MDLNTALTEARRPERTVSLCLRGDLVAEFEDLERQLQTEQQRNVDSLAGNPALQEIAEKIEALREQMTASSVVLRLRGISNPEWHALIRANEPRDGVADDKALGYNVDEFFPALVKACLVDVSDEQWQQLYGAISSGQFEQLSDAALSVSRRKVDVPKSFSASEILRKRDAKQS